MQDSPTTDFDNYLNFYKLRIQVRFKLRELIIFLNRDIDEGKLK